MSPARATSSRACPASPQRTAVGRGARFRVSPVRLLVRNYPFEAIGDGRYEAALRSAKVPDPVKLPACRNAWQAVHQPGMVGKQVADARRSGGAKASVSS